MNPNKKVALCPNCGHEVFGFWKHGQYNPCSLECLRALIISREIPQLVQERAYPELGIAPPIKIK